MIWNWNNLLSKKEEEEKRQWHFIPEVKILLNSLKGNS